MNGNRKNNKCISKEILSAYFDGEASLNEENLIHLENCNICKNQLKEFKLFSEALNKMMKTEPSESLYPKIIQKFKNESNQQPQNAFHFLAILTKAASVIFALGLISFFSYHFINKNNNTTALNQKNNIDKVVFLDHSNSNSQLNQPTKSIGNTGNIDLNKFSHVSTNYTPDNTTFIKKQINTPKINKSVSHFWLTDNPKKTIAFLKNNLPDKTIIKNNLNNGTLNVSMHLKKKDLVNLVRKLHSNGYTLLSPNQPQPEVQTFNGAPNEQVIYNVTFSQK